jgi:hypothetical protein
MSWVIAVMALALVVTNSFVQADTKTPSCAPSVKPHILIIDHVQPRKVQL